MVSIDSME
jgi:hypothetical protein